MHDVQQGLESTRRRIIDAEQQFNREPGDVRLLAVSKKHSIEKIKQAIACDQHAFGENYLQEALEKIHALNEYPLQWHYIGQIQSNKTKVIAQHFDWVHSVDRLKIAQRLSQQRPDPLTPLNILLQVNISQEPQKAGITLDEIEPLAKEMTQLPHIRLRGLMAIPIKMGSIEQQRTVFKQLHDHFISLKNTYPHIDTLSMGMSDDLEAAIAEGSTMVRIGTNIFGPRSYSIRN